MDRLAEHEAFLRAIFDAPDDDTPRLLYADFLDENGDPARAELIRLQCELARTGAPGAADGPRPLTPRERELAAAVGPAGDPEAMGYSRGFAHCHAALIDADDLDDPDALRGTIVTKHPEWFGATRVKVQPGDLLQEHQIEPLLALPALARVTEWDLGGYVDETFDSTEPADAGTYGLVDLIHHPVITVEGVEALARSRAARRIETLILTQNNLDNDAARALIRSPYLIRLKRLELDPGNVFSGELWAQLRERFGAAVLGG